MAASVAAVMALCFICAAPRFPDLSSQKIEAEEVSVLPHSGQGPFRRRKVNEEVYDLNSAFKIPMRTRRQYTHAFTVDQIPPQGGEVFAPYVGGAAEVYMNGVRFGTDTDANVHFPGLARRYIMLDIPVAAYQSGRNRLTIVVTPDRSYAGLPELFVGRRNDFLEAQARQAGWLNVLHFVQIATGAVIVFLAAAGFFVRARFGVYLPLMLIGSGLIVLAYLSTAHRLPMPGLQTDFALATYGIMGLSCLGLLRWLPMGDRPVLLGLWGLGIASSLIAVAFLLPIQRPPSAHLLTYLIVAGLAPFGVYVGLTSLLEDRRLAKRSQAELQKVVSRQQAIISAQEAAIEEGLKAKGRLEERQRLTRDIHDGIGGQLLSLLVRVRGGEISSAEIENDLQYGLNDLRLIVDSMDHSEGSFDSALVTFKARAQAQLIAEGIALQWEQSDPFVPTYFGPAAILNIYRLMQEAVTNSMRHADCDELSISICRETESDDLVITIADNGVGFATGGDPDAGQGLKNMRYRARVLNGKLDICESASGGVRIQLTVEPENRGRALSRIDVDQAALKRFEYRFIA
ncbi:hypothetical protein HY29_18240 [Hyphomonas beringensis]|uniref:histidine kinase n=1 Tax=Hyphomonas beringensis TaxID=1280946 RepID=A0A062TVX9_9PROT|nr:ATP-binding protein [Hyphomonas beringensis]KCZ52151.1 hypothetical protein HY29_18240 [Hyphomonas beringensis]